MSKSRADVLTNKLLVSDGAWGTELSKRGLAPGELPESWNLNRADDVRGVAASYVEAGADIVLTNSFGGNRFKLGKSSLVGRLVEVNRRAAELSKEAAGDTVLVFASVGSTGEFMAPLGTVSEAEMVDCFAEQARALAAGGADGIVIETMTDLAEALAALRAAKENTSLPVVVSMTFDKGAQGYATMMGVKPEQAAEALAGAGADAVGANCGAGIENMIEVARLMKPVLSVPLWVKANAGLPELVDGKTVFRQSPDVMAQHVGELVAAGANIVGGCCGTTPEHIRLLVAQCDKLRQG